MTLRKKTILFILTLIIVALVVLAFLSNSLVLDKFRDLEAQNIQENANRVVSQVAQEENTLGRVLANYSAWDDTYHFIQQQSLSPTKALDSKYIQDNYPGATFSENALDIVVMFSADDSVIYAQQYDYKTHTLHAVSPSILKVFRQSRYHLLQFKSGTQIKSGFVNTPMGPLITASAPIVHSDFSGPIRGTVIFARMFNQAEVSRLGRALRLPLVLQPNSRALAPNLNVGNTWTQPSSQAVTSGYAEFRDLSGNKSSVVSFQVPRSIYQQGVKTVYLFFGFTVGLAILASVAFFVFIEKVYMARLVALMKSMMKIRLTKDFSARAAVNGDDELAGLQLEFNNMMESLQESQEIIQFQANHDPLTRLPNRLTFARELDASIDFAKRKGFKVGILFIDLDKFKSVNDTLGHAVGDELLLRVTQRVRNAVRDGDVVSRLAGDEFTVLLPNLEDLNQITHITDRIVEALGNPFQVGAHQIVLTASIGISVFPFDGVDAQSLLTNADTAMFKVKQGGRNHYRMYTCAMSEHMSRAALIEQHLPAAITHEEFQLVYQPKVNVRTGRLAGAEALLRWNSPELGVVSPAEFIPIAESTGLILSLGEWVLKTSCRQIVSWKENGYENQRVAINLSGVQLKQENLVDSIKAILTETGCPAECIELEITESVAMYNVERVIEQLHQLKSLGIRLAIDDFGTGYSSLSYLKRFPIHSLKVDQSFVNDLTMNSDETIAKAIIDLGHNLNLLVCGEGVETQEQMEFLIRQNCDEVQGYYFSKPLTDDQLDDILERMKEQDWSYFTHTEVKL